jgi:hypothetical protein
MVFTEQLYRMIGRRARVELFQSVFSGCHVVSIKFFGQKSGQNLVRRFFDICFKSLFQQNFHQLAWKWRREWDSNPRYGFP